MPPRPAAPHLTRRPQHKHHKSDKKSKKHKHHRKSKKSSKSKKRKRSRSRSDSDSDSSGSDESDAESDADSDGYRAAATSHGAVDQNSFGKYGIVRSGDFYKKEREFEFWLAEVKKMPSFSGAKWEQQELFKECVKRGAAVLPTLLLLPHRTPDAPRPPLRYAEDFNTCSLPHKKYYNYGAWEIEQHRKAMKAAGGGSASAAAAFDDEAVLLAQRRKEKAAQESTGIAAVANALSRERLKEMKERERLTAELTNAHRRGDRAKMAECQRALDGMLSMTQDAAMEREMAERLVKIHARR